MDIRFHGTFKICTAALVLLLASGVGRAAEPVPSTGATPDSHVESTDQDTATSGTEAETETETDVAATPLGKLPVSLFLTSFLTGPPVSNPTSGETVAYIEGNTLGLSVENQLGFTYKFTKDMSISPVFDFEYQFTDPHNNGENKRLALTYDSFVKLYRSNVVGYDVGNNYASLDLEGRVYVPTSEFSRNNESLGSVRIAANPGVEFGKSGFAFYMVNFVRYWIQTRTYEGGRQRTSISLANRSRTLPEWTFYTGPQISYRINEKVSAWVLYETSRTVDTLGVSNTSNPRASLADIEPGVDIRLNPHVTISPYLNWYTKQPIDTTSINVTAHITI